MDISEETAAVIKRAKEAGLETETRDVRYEDGVSIYHFIVFSRGGKKRPIGVSSQKKASLLLSIEFERFSFLDDYAAIVDLNRGEIEAAIMAREPFGMSMLERRLGFAQIPGSDEEDGSDAEVEFALRAERPDGVSVEISKYTEELAALALWPSARPQLSLKISLGGERKYASALKALETISNSLFFSWT